jgi:pyruvate/2-oxoglutarate dehydrogenase complex dihydrolipoamide dehydrogenase (E3) component
MAEKFDAIIIGAGQAGPALAARLDRQGQKTALIERKLVGGDRRQVRHQRQLVR